MTTTRTVEIPADRRITIEVPREVPAGRVVLTFTPASEAENPKYNAKALTAIAEAEAIIKGEISANWHKPKELEKVWKETLED
ncbi:MAG: hypothetical protein FWC06_08380 [Treponema sp.]|nr:hypothetical protein [Treponema sp.]